MKKTESEEKSLGKYIHDNHFSEKLRSRLDDDDDDGDGKSDGSLESPI